MDRKILIELENDDSYDSAFNLIQQFDSLYEKQIGFSANVGRFGGFVTDCEQTWQLWQIWIQARKTAI